MSQLKTAQAYLAQVLPQINEISADKLAEKMAIANNNNQSLVIIDVRETAEYQQGAMLGAKHISRGTLEMNIHSYLAEIGKLSAEQEIVLYCRSGGRSALAALSLQNMGFTNVYSLAGGFARHI
ncbi:rhodanese-like domain-containing protein [Catenovulum agarivorans]|uniref:rhodanese-like domain-containing protein n=1 Tax=Catenovulum agarivorans TaxID=1172192 RepID=UPI0002DE84DC|nr:rhodanese-like domain-containing protein [Catenovulum agarivorans]